MVIVKNLLFDKEVKDKYLLVLMLFLEVNKNYIGKMIFTVNLFFSMFKIKNTNTNMKYAKNALDKLIDLDIISMKNLDTREKLKNADDVKLNTPLFISTFYDERPFRKYDDEFIFHMLEVLSGNKNFYTSVEIYLYIISKMFYDEYGGYSPTHVSYRNIVDNTSVRSKSTIPSHLKTLEDGGLLEVAKDVSESTGHSYNTFTIPKELFE